MRLRLRLRMRLRLRLFVVFADVVTTLFAAVATGRDWGVLAAQTVALGGQARGVGGSRGRRNGGISARRRV